MKRFLNSALALAAAFALSAAAPSSSSKLTSAFSGTIVSTYPDGRKAKLWLSPDGTYRAEGRKQDMSNGVWQLKGSDQICLRQKKPATLPLSFCTAVPSGGAGSSWAAKSVTGDPLHVTLISGR